MQAGWAKLLELRQYVALYRKSGKFCIALMKNAGEKEYFLASAFGEVYVPPSASIRLAGFSTQGEKRVRKMWMVQCNRGLVCSC